MKLRQTISLILACMMAALQPSSIVYASDIENNITQESVEDVGSNTENVEDINESTEAVNENESVEISDDIQSNDIESSMEENTANQQNNGTVEDKITDDIFSDGSTGNNLSASEDYLSDLTVRDNENKEDNTNNEVKKILSADVILPNDQTDKVTVSLKNDFNEGDKLVVNYLEGEELDKCINGINDKKNANQDSKNNSNIEIDSILPLHMVITDANGSEIQGVENYEIKISEANTNSAEFFKNLKLFHQKQTGEWEEISWNTDNDVETGLTFIDWTTQNLGNFVFVKEKVQPVKDEEADVTVEDAKSVAISDKSGIEQEKADEKSDAKCTCDTNTDNAYKHAWNCPVFLEQLKKDCTCDSENEKVTSHNFECEAFKKAITEICTCETKDAPGMHDNCKVIRRMHDELCDCGRKYDSVDDIIDNHEKDSNIVTYLMKWADYANQPEIIATTYTIKYNLNGGSISGQKTKYTSTTATFTLPTPRRTGYTFTGWTGTGLSSATKTVTIKKGSKGNRTYTAHWSVNNYRFDINGWLDGQDMTYITGYGTMDVYLNGSMFANDVGDFCDNYPYGTTYTITDIKPTPGHTYNGVQSGSLSGTIGAGLTKVSLNFTSNHYRLTLNPNGGAFSDGSTGARALTGADLIYGHGNWNNLAGNPVTRYNCNFAGWYTAPSGGTKLYDANGSCLESSYWSNNQYYGTSDLTVYAQWSPYVHTVAYNANGGVGAPASQTKTYLVQLNLSTDKPTRTGYIFASWNTAADGSGTKWNPGDNYTPDYNGGTVTLYAQWTKDTYTISYNLNGGKISGQKTSYDVTTEAFTLPTPTRNGYTFTGWTGTGLSSATKTVTVAKGSTGNRSYTANWSANVLTINYHNDGATGFKWSDDSKYDDITGKDIILTEKYSYDSEYGPVYGLPNTSRLYKIGYHYDGYWYLDKKNSSVKVSDQLKLPKTQDVANAFGKLTDFEKGNTTIDVYASLIPNVLTVNYYPNGATKIDKSNDEDGSDIIDIDSNVVYKTEEFKYDTEMRHYGLDDSRRFIRAGYHSENTYTVDSYDSKVSLNAGSGIYANTQDMAKTAGKLTDLENGNVTINIYAYWIPNTYVIKYNGNGSTSGSMTDSSCTYDTAFSLSKNTFSRKGYLFCGWNTQSDGKGTPYKDNESIKNLSSENEKTIILYAQWTPIKYTVKYDANGGTGEVPADTTHTFNEKGTIYPENALAKNAFTRKGYKFSGWNASRVKDGKIEWYYDNWNWYEEGKNPKSASKYVWTDGGDTHNASDVNGDILTMHAQWKANTLTINYHNDNGATWRQYPDDSTIDVSNKDIVQSETVTYDEKYKHYEFGLIDAGRLTKAGYHLNNGWKINSMDSKTIVPDTNGSMNSYENSGKGVADFLGVLTGFEKGDVTVDLYPDIAINTGTVHYYPNSNEAVAKAGYDQYITNGEFAGSLATTTSFDYKTTGGSGANTLTDVYTLFERKGYHQSAAQNWHYGSPDSDVYFHCDEEDLSPYVKDATDVHLKLYANWISNDYTVKFDGNGSTSGNMADVTCKYDKSFNLTENKFIRNNYEFIGWNTKKDGSGQDYKDKESVKNLTDEDNGTVTLYAQWKLKEYTLTVSHTISGNMGNRDKDFSFTMSLSNSNKDAVIPENIEAVFMDDIGNKSKKLFTVVDEKVTFTLSHKESLIFKDIPYGTLYTISEDNENEYDVTNESASGTITKNIEVSFVSTKNGTVPTSSDTPNLYPIIMIAFAGIIYVILSQRKKKIKQKR